MSWEANIWACKQRMKLPQEQLVLIVLGNCADPDGVAFSKWPGRDHWWKYLAKITRLSKSSLFRHINTIVSLGLATRATLVLADGSRRPTISLDLTATFDIEAEEERYEQAAHSRQSHGETGSEEASDAAETSSDANTLQAENEADASQSHHETSPTSGTETAAAIPTHGTDPVPPAGLHIDSSKSCSKDSPLPPASGGPHVSGFEDFKKAWVRPIDRLSVAESVWARIPTDRRGEAIAAARGYVAFHAKQSKPQALMAAQTFLREQSGWAQWLPYAPDADGIAPSLTSSYPLGTLEAKALVALHEIAGLSQFLRSILIRNGAVNFQRPITVRMRALAESGPKDFWPVLSRQQAAAWESFLRETVAVQVRKPLKEGDRAPWPWPPSAEGKIYATGPPDAELSEQDMADFR